MALALRLTYTVLPRLAVHRFSRAADSVEDAALIGQLAAVLASNLPLTSLSLSADEISLVVSEDALLPVAATSTEAGWTTFKVEGPLDFALTGILSSLTAPLAAAAIPVFAVSTYDTDYILVKFDKAQGAIDAWHTSGIASVTTSS
ncbi:hypothetical protein DYB37_010289 [Aphanomyces astaci]|uniref:CASTOR ACT domain-containing protein n=1 Tax=Aphanomyces astaci TaxID=112090 RepID=A0A396ZVM1_APHAT|nr:hypothetical protein AaE_000618 [Aphanomyces astaci]RHX97150.1 hypothetical protein DYB36_012043 [Aphanomyces astaci]RHY20895.1 hypothetical protein DYB25_008418 [Aphanomyces astaci]RHY45737.1 hypothetical protein DYB30_008657 [Aphanomyces astaci]RHY63583.1 hypothetical protein DYB38_001664 [Aphanomyces astaci]